MFLVGPVLVSSGQLWSFRAAHQQQLPRIPAVNQQLGLRTLLVAPNHDAVQPSSELVRARTRVDCGWTDSLVEPSLSKSRSMELNSTCQHASYWDWCTVQQAYIHVCMRRRCRYGCLRLCGGVASFTTSSPQDSLILALPVLGIEHGTQSTLTTGQSSLGLTSFAFAASPPCSVRREGATVSMPSVQFRPADYFMTVQYCSPYSVDSLADARKLNFATLALVAHPVPHPRPDHGNFWPPPSIPMLPAHLELHIPLEKPVLPDTVGRVSSVQSTYATMHDRLLFSHPPPSQDSIRDLQRTLSARLQTRCSGRSCQILPSRVRAPRGHAIRLPTLAGVCWYQDSLSWHLSADDARQLCPEKLLRQGLLLSTLNGAVSHAGLSLPIPSPLLVA